MDPRDLVTVPDADGEEEPLPRLGHFELGEKLGEGGMGVVFEARDTLLDRRVALKLLRPGAGGEVARARLVREAQALARLSHPNVVTVYEVADAGDVVFAAMELIDGTTLREWMKPARPWREVVDVFLAAGRGLAAVHALGLVHRDFKPANVLIDREGRVRVGDFGLVGLVEERAPGEAPEAFESGDLTVTGAMGTPAYMAPEQRETGDVDARADQYSFALSMVEALIGRADRAALEEVPARLRPILARALAPDPGARFPTMDGLLAALARARRPRTAWLAGGAAAAALAGAAIAWRLGGAAPDPCPAPEPRLAAMWGEARRGAVRDRVAAIDPAQGDTRLAAIGRVVEPFVADWRAMHRASCRATRVDATQSDTAFDLRARCLERRAAELDASVAAVLAAKNAVALDSAVTGLAGLAPVDGCADTDDLAREDLPGARRPAAEALALRVQGVEVDLRADRLVGLPERAAEVVAEARTFGHGPSLAAALAALGRVQLAVGDHTGGAGTLRELTQVAAGAHDHRREAYAWTRLIVLVGFHQGKREEGLALVPAASAAVLRAGEPVDARADLLHAEGQLLVEGPRAAEGLARLDEARRILEEAGAGQAGSPLAHRLADVLSELAIGFDNAGDVDRSVAYFRDAIARFRAILGPDSTDEAIVLHNLGETLRFAGRFDEAKQALEEAIRIDEARAGDSPRLGQNLVGLAAILEAQGDAAGALAVYERSLVQLRAHYGPADVELVPALTGRASALDRSGRAEEALVAYDELLALIEGAGATTLNLPIALYNRAELHARGGRCEEALVDYGRSTREFEAQDGAESSFLAYPLVGEGRCLVLTARAAAALPPLERAVALESKGGDAVQVATGKAWLGRALVESRRDRRRGLALARAAREVLAGVEGDPRGPAALAELDAWLAKAAP